MKISRSRAHAEKRGIRQNRWVTRQKLVAEEESNRQAMTKQPLMGPTKRISNVLG